jgi:mannobiose 2-epimerase
MTSQPPLWAAEMEEELHRILSWWRTNMTDTLQGGFYGRIDGFDQLHPDAEKGCVLNARILWAFSAAARATNRYEYLESAHRAFNYLRDFFWDELYGGVFWSVDFHGAPLQTKKQVYAQAFAQYALVEYYLLTQQQEAYDLALEIYFLLEKNAFDTAQNGYFEAYTREWAPLADLRLSDKDANEAKTQNTHLHVLESYTHLCRIAPTPAIKHSLKNLTELFTQYFIDPETHHIHLFFDENWQLKSQIISYGHDIEASWLIWEAATVLGDETLRATCLDIAEATINEGTLADGSVINEYYGDTRGKDAALVWWVQAEAMVGFYNAYQLSGEIRYWEAAEKCWRYIQSHLVDPNGGEWFWQINADGSANREQDKAGFWKCPYHNTRALLEMIKRIGPPSAPTK